jgi:7-carboxy-7-deazaguanine synthase
MKNEVNLIENFVSWQGEGPDSGKTMIILRFKTCDRNCPWCDTKVKMRVSSEAPYKLTDIQKTIYKKSAGLLITGGEPTVERHIDEAESLLSRLDYPCANVETNGYNIIRLINRIDLNKPVKFVLSPKIFNANEGQRYREILKKIHDHPHLYLKMVYEPNNEYSCNFLRHISDEYQDMVKRQRVWLMPEGVTREELLKNAPAVFDICDEYNFNFSSRSHIIFNFV